MQLYEGSGLFPFTASWGWQTLPWLVVLAVAVDYLLHKGDVNVGVWHRKWRYPFYWFFGTLYLGLSFLPLNITIGPVP